MSRYQYSSLLPGPNSIRLLRLLPHEDENAPIQCQLLDFSLQESGKRTLLYDALSYVWGDPNNVRSIYIAEHYLAVTENLYAALLQLRDFSFERIIWVDAVCINQENVKEKENQIQLMAKIYSQATRVLVWLGKARDNSDQALEEIRAAGRDARSSIDHEFISLAVLDLLQRTWFRRIWILQEVAAARHILIMCGSTEIDGHAFCLGIDSLTEYFQAHTELQGLIRSVTYLIRGAIFRTGRLPQAIGPLGELIDMYHGHKAALLHDKVYALLGMNSEDLGDVNLRPDYKLSWEELFQRLTRFLLGNIGSMEICTSTEIAIIKTKACILGKISSVEKSISLDGRQGVEIILGSTSSQLRHEVEQIAHWTLHPTAHPVLAGDFICLLQGVSKPTVIRLRKDHFIIIMIAVSPPEMEQTESAIQGRVLLQRDFLLVWDWTGARTSQYIGEDGKALLRKNNWVLGSSKAEAADDLNKAARIWNVVITLDDLEEQKEAEERLEAMLGLETAFEKEFLCLPKFSRAPLLWAARSGHEAMVKLLLEKGAEVERKTFYDGRTPLSWAARNGHEAVVKLLLEHSAEVNSEDRDKQTPLLWAARNGHEAVVKLLLENGAKVDRLHFHNGQTPLSWAAGNGHEAVVKLLLEKGAKFDRQNFHDGQTPLSCAAGNGHEAIVKLILEKGAEVDLWDECHRTPLSYAAGNGHEVVVKLLLENGAEVDLWDDDYRTPLSWAAQNGHEAVIKLLLERGAEAYRKDFINSRPPLSFTAQMAVYKSRHEAVIKLLQQ